MSELFGTDGIRGIANSYPIIPEVAIKVGRAAARHLGKDRKPCVFVIGQDTRGSGEMLVHALASGICAAGAEAHLLGVLPTPGIAFLTRDIGASGGIVVSASHNPYEDNGIKIFGPDGRKLSDADELALEEEVLSGLKKPPETGAGPDPGRSRLTADAVRRYAEFLKSCVHRSQAVFAGLRVVLDCAHGATSEVAPLVFSELGAEVETIHAAPDGRNINAGCGSQHPERLAEKVLSSKAAIGLAFDGDGDRLVAVDETGDILTGDRILAVCAAHLKAKGLLSNGTVVSTVMSNIGLGEALKRLGLRHLTTNVGDRYVMEAMLSSGAVVGGEDSGHMIFARHHSTGDGILSGLKLLEAVVEQGRPLSDLKRVMQVFPQALINVTVRSKPPIETVPEIRSAIEGVERMLDGRGRVLVRYSGTQAVCRVMVEGPTEEITRTACRDIAAAVEKTLG